MFSISSALARYHRTCFFTSFLDLEILNETVLGTTLESLAYFAGFLIVTFSLIKLFQLLVVRKLKRIAERTPTSIDDFLLDRFEKEINPLLYACAVYLGLQYLTLIPGARKLTDGVLTAVITFFAVRLIVSLVSTLIVRKWSLPSLSETAESSAETLELRSKNLRGLLTIVRLLLWGIGLVFLLDNLGFEITAVVTGLGIGGIAVALAAQAVLGDLFSYVAIFFDRPFEVGDFIIVGEFMGTVDRIGMKTTRITSLSGEQIVISNSDLTNSRLRNYKHMDRRRVLNKIGVTYDTSLSDLKAIPEIIRSIVAQSSDAAIDRAHLLGYGDSSIDFEYVYYVIGSDYNKYMDIQQTVNLGIREEFDARGIQFAFPTRTIHIETVERTDESR